MKKSSNKSFTVNVIATICIVTMLNIMGFSQTYTYPVVGTGKTISYDTAVAITMPTSGQPFYGQNSNHPGNMRSYTNNGNGTVTDNLTGLMWQQTEDRNGDGATLLFLRHCRQTEQAPPMCASGERWAIFPV